MESTSSEMHLYCRFGSKIAFNKKSMWRDVFRKNPSLQHSTSTEKEIWLLWSHKFKSSNVPFAIQVERISSSRNSAKEIRKTQKLIRQSHYNWKFWNLKEQFCELGQHAVFFIVHCSHSYNINNKHFFLKFNCIVQHTKCSMEIFLLLFVLKKLL